MKRPNNALKMLSLVAIMLLASSCEFSDGSNKTDSQNDSSTFEETSGGGDSYSWDSSSYETDEKLSKLTIISVNDVHGMMRRTDNGVYGIANVAAKFNDIRNENNLDDVITISNGDQFQGDALSNLSHGRSMINAMNAMNFDALGVGNHEFDWGVEEICQYFDGNQENGEANFPWVNANVTKISTGELLENTVPFQIVQKENLRVGIVSTIGVDQKNSILAPLVQDYSFNNAITATGQTAAILRGTYNCDVVIANIHDGSENYGSISTTNNNGFANLSGDQRIDAIINGHTHYYYAGNISRSGSFPVPVVQAGEYNKYVGRIDLTINPNTKEVTSGAASVISMASYTKYDETVEAIVMDEYNAVKDTIEEVYGVAGDTVSYTDYLAPWAGQVMLQAVGADVAFGNYGGLRKVNLVNNRNVTISDLYEIVPFDNEIWVIDILGSRINSFINSYSSSNYHAKGSNITSFIANEYYKVAVIDYLYYKNYFPKGINDVNTNLIYRDMLGIDIKCWTALGQKFCPVSNPYAALPLQNY